MVTGVRYRLTMSRTSLTRAGLALVAMAAVAGCFTSTADFRDEAETFIVDLTIPDEPDVSFPTATCEEPARQDPGTVFGCTALDNEGSTWTFEVTIEEDNEIVVGVSDRP